MSESESTTEQTTEQTTKTTVAPVSVVNADGSYVENWYEKYGEENKAHLSRYKTHDDLVNSHIATKKKFGKNPDALIEIPTEHSSDEVKADFRKARGVPDSVDAYEYTLSDELAVKLGPLRDDLMTKVRDHAHKQGWSPQEFKENLDLYHDVMSGDIDSFGEQTTKQAAEAAEKGKAELRKRDGWRSEEEYKAKVQRAQSIMEKYDGVNVVADLNLQNEPKMLVFLDNIAESMSEDTLKGLAPSGATTAANINSQLTDIYSQLAVIMKENPANFKNNSKYKELIQRKHGLNKEKKMSA